MNKKIIWKTTKTLLIAIPVLLLAFVIFLLGWLRERKFADYRQFFADHQQELTLYSDAFLEQNDIVRITRTQDFDGIGYSVNTKSGDTYSESAYISFTVPYWEDTFWRTADISKIRGDAMASPDQTLGSLLAANGITEEEFLKWRSFLEKHDFICIERVYGEEGVVDIYKTSWCGFEHRKGTGTDFGYGTEYMDVLNDYWIYFDEDGINHSNQ